MRICIGTVVLAALALAWAALPGCAVNETKEVAIYRTMLDESLPASVEAPAPDQVITLRRALELANAHNERLGISGEDYLQALIEKDRAVSALLPQISLKPSFAQFDNFVAPAFAYTFFPLRYADVQADTHWDIRITDLANVARAEVLAKYRAAILLDLQADILVETAETYYQVLRLERQVKVLENSVAVQDSRVRDMRDKFNAGTVRPLDVSQTEAQAAATRASRVEARAKVVQARAVLALLIGQPAVRNPLDDRFELPPVPPVEELQEQAETYRQDILAAEALVAAADKSLMAAWAQYYPSLSVDFNYWLARESFPMDSNWFFGVNVNLPLFQGGRIHANVRTAYSLVRQAHLYRSFTRRQVAEQVTVAYADLKSSGDRLVELRTEVRAARDAFGLADQSFDVGLATNLQRLIAQDQLLQAELQLASEELNHKTLYLRLTRAIGRLIDEMPQPPAPEGAATPAS